MKNLKEETLEVLERFGKTPDSIIWIGCQSFKISKDEFWELADVVYDSGYGAQEVATDLVIVGADWWLERIEYDGAERWSYREPPREPFKTESISHLTVYGTDHVGWATLGELNDLDKYEWEDDDE